MKLLPALFYSLAVAGVLSIRIGHHTPDGEPHNSLQGTESLAPQHQEQTPHNGETKANAPEKHVSEEHDGKVTQPADADAHAQVRDGNRLPEAPKAVEKKRTEAGVKQHSNQSLPRVVTPVKDSKTESPAPKHPVDATASTPQSHVTQSGTNEAPKPAVSTEKEEAPTLETLVNSGSICEKQKIVSEFLKEQLQDGPLRSNFDYKRSTNPALVQCKSMVKNPLRVCKTTSTTAKRGCLNSDMFKLVDKYMAYGVCTVEAALNQLYHKEHTADFVANDIDSLIELINAVPFLSGELKEMYTRTDEILRLLRSLFKEAELALVSPEVQRILYKRWAIIDAILCGVAEGASNDIMNSISVDLDRRKAQANIDVEDFLSEATEVFLNAYKPLEKFVDAFESGLLTKAVKLNKDDFESNVREMLPVLSEAHQPAISDSAIDELRKMPHSGLDAKDVDKIASQIGSSVSLVQEGEDVSTTDGAERKSEDNVEDNRPAYAKIGDVKEQAENINPVEAFRKVLLNLDMFTYKGDHILPKLDEEKIKTMTREAILDVSDEEMVAKLIVKQQAALRVVYYMIKLLVKLPGADIVSQLKGNKVLTQFGAIAKFVDSQFNSIKETFAKASQGPNKPAAPEAERPLETPQPSMLQLSQGPEHARAVQASANISPEFIVESNPGKTKLDKKIDDYIELQNFQKDQTSLLNVKVYDSVSFRPLNVIDTQATFASILSAVLISVFTIF
ncbi:putative membrane protein [Babesia divergens]|uniref:Membrane protein n=1 Tax=Babesia divergens TaxID=32595 RepID=A0AAD9LGT6_BABDI|nr:putative membrane protein [Babesia divergens]